MKEDRNQRDPRGPNDSLFGDFIRLPESQGAPAPKNRIEPVEVDERIGDLVALLKETVDKMAADRVSRGDLKIISRTVRELRYAFKVFAPFRRIRKVTVFGSARTKEHEPAYRQAVKFGQAIAAQNWMVVTGAASGIMEAGHVGAGRENSMGINIMLPFEQGSNPIIAGDKKLVHMKYFFTRKLMFVKECDALCCMPGGFGTLDEATEVLTLLQTGKRDMVPIVFLDAPGGSYWRDFAQFVNKQLLDARMISPEDLSLFKVTEDVDEAVREIVDFFHTYHSMRYVHDRLVMRLQHAPSEEQMATINERFADVLASGKFELHLEPMEEERDETELMGLPRLVMHFNRRSLGRLRQLIDWLNANCRGTSAAN
ncbi:MAG: TIGR00730 family Rossman fold protein [Planctomycetaceae bacterium]|nr:TIGR00730 family Rossman fold protein [Planctomycetaceae bacterium]